LIIAADGTESQIVRWAGLKSVPPMGDYYVGFQYLLGNLKGRIDPAICEYHLGNELFPGGYGWVFPKGEDTANVGLVITADHAKDISAKAYLDRFVARYAPNASILGAVAGGIPATGALKKMVVDGVMAVGDAAHQADPLTAGGINLGMIGADLASQVAVKALHKGDVSARMLSEYERLWHGRFGRMHAALYQVRKLLSKLENDRLAGLIRTASTFDIEHISLGELFLGVMKDHPRMLIEARTLVTTGLLIK
jgi:digeranylgeranylglycerophospholipid reductase